MMRNLVLTITLFIPALASAQIAPECAEADGSPSLAMPDDYDEQVQQDFLANYPALAMTYSPAHAPIPHAPGRGSIGVGLNVLPPLGCEKRMVLDWTKTEDPNKTPIAPIFRASFAFPKVGPLHIYAGVGYLPPLNLPDGGNILRNVIFQGELGVGVGVGPEEAIQIGGRFHASSMKTVADAVTAFSDDEPSVLDFYLASTLGVDLMGGYFIESANLTPYFAVGFTDVSTFLFIGDDGLAVANQHPYAGLTFSVGADGLVKDRLRWGVEFYGAPGGYSAPTSAIAGEEPLDVTSVDGADYGSIYTARFHLALEI